MVVRVYPVIEPAVEPEWEMVEPSREGQVFDLVRQWRETKAAMSKERDAMNIAFVIKGGLCIVILVAGSLFCALNSGLIAAAGAVATVGFGFFAGLAACEPDSFRQANWDRLKEQRKALEDAILAAVQPVEGEPRIDVRSFL